MKKKSLLIPYITAGFPAKKLFLPILRTLSLAGANYIEVGVPHSDPLADGTVIQQASNIAINDGVTLRWIVNNSRTITPKAGISPLILFSYLNPIFQYGFEKLLRDLPKPLFYGLIIPDLPLEEASRYMKIFKKYNLKLILLVAPTTDKTRIKKIVNITGGFVYLVSVTGVTGEGKALSKELKEKIKQIRAYTKKPIAVGFGISSPAQLMQVRSYGADGVVIGSAIIKLLSKIKRKQDLRKLERFLSRFK